MFKAVFNVKFLTVRSSVFHQEWWAEVHHASRARPACLVPTTVAITLLAIILPNPEPNQSLGKMLPISAEPNPKMAPDLIQH